MSDDGQGAWLFFGVGSIFQLVLAADKELQFPRFVTALGDFVESCHELLKTNVELGTFPSHLFLQRAGGLSICDIGGNWRWSTNWY